MVRKFSVVLAALALMVAAPMAHAAMGTGGMSLSIGGGLTIPMGDFSKSPDASTVGLAAGLGYMITPELDFMINDKLSLGVDGTWGSNSIKSDDRDKLRVASGDPSLEVKYTEVGGGAHAKVMMPMQNGPLSPYLVLGAGMMNFKAKADSNNPLFAGETSKSGFAGRVGVGAGYKAGGQTSIGLEADYNFVSLKKEDFGGVSSAPSVGVKAVVTFKFQGNNAAK